VQFLTKKSLMDIATFLGARTVPVKEKALWDISTFLGPGTVPDKEKPDEHFDISRIRDSS
jgi:hypothetical protein